MSGLILPFGDGGKNNQEPRPEQSNGSGPQMRKVSVGSINPRRSVEEMSIEDLRKEVEISRNLIVLMASAFNGMVSAMQGRPGAQIPPVVGVPTPWLEEAFQLILGNTLAEGPESSLAISGDCYISNFYDRNGVDHAYVFDFQTGVACLRSDVAGPGPIPGTPETFLWHQAATFATMIQVFRRHKMVAPSMETIFDAFSSQFEVYNDIEAGKLQLEIPEKLMRSLQIVYTAFRNWEEFMEKRQVDFSFIDVVESVPEESFVSSVVIANPGTEVE